MKRREITKIGKWVWTYFPQNLAGYLTVKPNTSIESTLVLVEGKLTLYRDKKGEIIGIEYIG